MLRAIQVDDAAPREVVDVLHKLRRVGNEAVHAGREERRDEKRHVHDVQITRESPNYRVGSTPTMGRNASEKHRALLAARDLSAR